VYFQSILAFDVYTRSVLGCRGGYEGVHDVYGAFVTSHLELEITLYIHTV